MAARPFAKEKWFALLLIAVPLLALIGFEADRSIDPSQRGSAISLALMMLGTILVGLLFYRDRQLDLDRHTNDQYFLQFIEGVPDYAIYMLDRSGNVISWNAGAHRIKGYTAAEIIGKHFSRFYTEEDRRINLPQRALETAENTGLFENESWRVRKDGSKFIANVILRPMRDQTGKLIGFAKITRDMTERTLHQEQLAASQAQLAQAQKMDALGKLSGGIAHDFNNLLQVINTCVDVLQLKLPPDRTQDAELLTMIKRNTERATSLSHRLLAFSRSQSLTPKLIDPNYLVEGVHEMLSRSLGKNMKLELALGSGVWPINVDPNQLEVALLNLAVNARDAMPQGGIFTIATANIVIDDRSLSSLPGAQAGEYVVLTVSDNGTGMGDETLARAFEPFYTTKAEGEGTGLGLSQVYGFIKQSDGHVAIKSSLGAGTTVALYLPRAS